MADDQILINEVNDKLITKAELINSGFAINKRRVMIDSRAYEKDAFEYILQLADIYGSLVFVWDTKKIWANGRYFGGDVFENDLLYFTHIISKEGDSMITGELHASQSLDTLALTGKNNLRVRANSNTKSVEFEYDLDSSVDKSIVQNTSDARYNLDVVDGQLKLNQYVPLLLGVKNPEPKEYDSGDISDAIFELIIYGSKAEEVNIDVNSNIAISPENVEAAYDPEHQQVKISEIKENTQVSVTFTANDGIEDAYATGYQYWGPGIYYGTIAESNLFRLKNPIDEYFSREADFILVNDSDINKSIQITQNEEEYAIFCCPEYLNIKFIDKDNNLEGGWRPYTMQTRYKDEHQMNYIIYMTENYGLGRVNWDIKLDI